ncbi:hypothetical protein [Paenibacillus solani]|uniref:Uncharacterized protein n=1 Tax=Paenibacillus solani TaxID=1705565 RepID=A0A0M1P0H8_9BACL|nr:hypothetical protein [Paenibacillus solani]KOR87872.1 hypothetical protein AM231_01120 [Paenibacillus solani]
MNKRLFLIAAASALLLGIGGYSYVNHHTEENQQVASPVIETELNATEPKLVKEDKISADHAIFANYEEALSASQVVAEVTVTEKSENVIIEGKGPSRGYTLTEVQVNKVFENKIGAEIGQTINVLEPTYFAESEEGLIRFNYEDYKKMESRLKYAVFLVWNEERQGYWINALEQGKFSVDNLDKAEMSLLSENSQYAELKKDVIDSLYGEVPKQENAVPSFTPLDESKYEGIQKEMVKLINLHAQYVNEQDEERFKELFNYQDYGLPSFEVLGLEIEDFHEMEGNQGLVSMILTIKPHEDNSLNEDLKFWYYIALNEEEGKWKIMSID